jgi:hypothetical protein
LVPGDGHFTAPAALPNPESGAPSRPPNPSAPNPALHAPGRPVEHLAVGNQVLNRAALQPHAAPKPAITKLDLGATVVQGQVSGDVRAVAAHGGGDDSGLRTLIWSSYDAPGTDRSDGVNGVAFGAGACTDDTVSVGFQGRVATVRTYSKFGGLVASQFYAPPGGMKARLNGVGIDPSTGDIFAVGTTRTAAGNLLVDNFIAKWHCGGAGGPVAMAFYAAGGGTLELRDVDFEFGVPSGLEVTAVGTADIGVGNEVIQVSHWDASLADVPTPHVDVMMNFGVPTRGLSVAIDDGAGGGMGLGTRYVGGNIDLTGAGLGVRPLNLDLNDADAVNTYARNWSFVGGVEGDRPTSGFYGIDQVGANLYMTGSLTDTFFNPAIAPDPDPYDNLVIVNVDAATSNVTFYGWGYVVAGGDYNSRGSDVNVFDGHLFTAGSLDLYAVQTDPQSLTEGNLTEFDQFGTFVAWRDSGDCDGVLNKDTDGSEVAVQYIPGPSSTVTVGGITNAGKASFEGGACATANGPQFLNGADKGYGSGVAANAKSGPPSDGYVFREDTPLGP